MERRNLKKEAEQWVAEQLEGGLTWTDNNQLSYLITGLIQGGAVLHAEAKDIDSTISLQFKNVNGIPSIKRYNVQDDTRIPENIKLIIAQFKGATSKDYIDSLLYDLMLIENKLMEAIGLCIESGENADFLQSEGITYRLYTDLAKQEAAIGPLRIAAFVVTDEHGEATVVYKYSTDNSVNMAFKSDVEHTSVL
jgi:hypothetical protein